MSVLIGLIEAAITLGAIALIIILVAVIFLIVASISNIFDKRTSNW